MESKLDIKSRFGRFKALDWFVNHDEKFTVTIGGCGGIGSWLSFYVNRGGFTPLIYDFDKLEDHNFGGQLFKTKHNGQTKVKAMAEVLSEFTGEQKFHIFATALDDSSVITEYCFSAFDNMKSRKMLFEKWLKQTQDIPNAIFIDGRLGAEHFQIFCIRRTDLDNISNYQTEHLFDDSAVPDLPCSAKQTSHVAGIISGFMFGFFTNHVSNVLEQDIIRTVPYETTYYLPINQFASE